MFFATYKTTMKTLVRSFLLWIVIGVALFIVMSNAMSVNVSYTKVENGLPVKQVLDTDPEFVLTRTSSIQTYVNGTVCWVMLYVIPVFCVVAVMTVLSRDYSDSFFEIQKSNGLKSFTDFISKLLAIMTINIIVYFALTYISINYYYFSRGGVAELTITEHFVDNITRITRMFITSALPAILFYTLLTYMLGSMLKSGFAAGAFGSGYVLFVYCAEGALRSKLPEEYHLYLTPASDVPYRYWAFYGTEWFESTRNPYTENQVLIWLGIMLISIVVFGTITLICTKRRIT